MLKIIYITCDLKLLFTFYSKILQVKHKYNIQILKKVMPFSSWYEMLNYTLIIIEYLIFIIVLNYKWYFEYINLDLYNLYFYFHILYHGLKWQFFEKNNFLIF